MVGPTNSGDAAMPLPQGHELDQVARKILLVEEALAGKRTYLGITDTALLVKELHSLRKKEEQIRDLQLILVQRMATTFSYPQVIPGMPPPLTVGGVGGAVVVGNAPFSAPAGALPAPSAAQAAPLGAAMGAAGVGGGSGGGGANLSSAVAAAAAGKATANGRKRTREAASPGTANAMGNNGTGAGEGGDGGGIGAAFSPDDPSLPYAAEGAAAVAAAATVAAPTSGAALLGGGDGQPGGGSASGNASKLEASGSSSFVRCDPARSQESKTGKRPSPRVLDLRPATPCKAPGCAKRPSFGDPGDVKGTYCGAHKREGMRLVNCRRRCLQEGCTRQPLYGMDADRVPLACGAHKSTIMVNVTHRRCIEPGCTTQPVYGEIPEGEEEKFCAVYCASHKKPGTVSMKRNRCVSNRCNRRASYGVAGGEGTLCAEHKTEGMTKMIQLHRRHQTPAQIAKNAAEGAAARDQEGYSSATVSAEGSSGRDGANQDADAGGGGGGGGGGGNGSVPRTISTATQALADSAIGSHAGGGDGHATGGSAASWTSTTGAPDGSGKGAGAGGAGVGEGAGGGGGASRPCEVGGARIREESEKTGNGVQRAPAAAAGYKRCIEGGGRGGTSSGRASSAPQQHQRQHLQRVAPASRQSLLSFPPLPHGQLPASMVSHQLLRAGRVLPSAAASAGSTQNGDGLLSPPPPTPPALHGHAYFQQQQPQHQLLPPLAAAHPGGALLPAPSTIHHPMIAGSSPVAAGMTHPVPLLSVTPGTSMTRNDQSGPAEFRDAS